MGSKLRGKPKSVWTDDEISRLRDLWGTTRDADVAAALGKTVSVVRFKATVLKLREEKGRRAGCRPGRITYPWNREEDLVLIKNVGHLSIFELLELLPRRNRVAIERRCYELGFAPTQGTYTRGKIERETGYDWRQIRRARDGLGQNWKRYGHRKYMISFDQVQEIIEYLKNEKRKWSRQYDIDECTKCKASGMGERERHSGDGLCKRCVTGETRVIVRNVGLVRIDALVGKGAVEVWSGAAWRKTEAICSGVKPVVEIGNSNGAVVRLTPDHEIITVRGKVEALALVDGDGLPVQMPEMAPFPITAKTNRRDCKYGGRLGDSFPFDWSRELGMLMGMVLGDGCIYYGKNPLVSIGCGAQDVADLETMNSLVHSWCDTKTKVVCRTTSPTRKCLAPAPMAFVQWRIGALAEFLGDLGLDKTADCSQRRVPSSVWTASVDGVAGFLAGMFGTDGSVSVNRNKKVEVSMASVSVGLLRDVQQLLFSFGIKSSIWSYPPRPENQLYALSVFGMDNVRKFSLSIGFSCKRKSDKLLSAISETAGRKPRSPKTPTARVMVRDLPPEPVYDLVNVGPERQFVANGISVSNCWDRRRHSRAWVIGAFVKGRMVHLNKHIWACIMANESLKRFAKVIEEKEDDENPVGNA